MREQLSELESTINKLEQITSLFNCMCDNYFEMREPDHYFTASYADISNVIEIIRSLVMGQKSTLNETTDKLYKVYWELKKLSEQNMALLKGGASND